MKLESLVYLIATEVEISGSVHEKKTHFKKSTDTSRKIEKTNTLTVKTVVLPIVSRN